MTLHKATDLGADEHSDEKSSMFIVYEKASLIYMVLPLGKKNIKEHIKTGDMLTTLSWKPNTVAS